MRSPLWLVLAAVWLAVAAGLKARETGHFPPNYAGGDNYYYDDPSLAKLMPLLFRNHANMTCSDDRHSTPFLKQIRGVNLGGWLVLEPWITPSLFYQFLGADERWGDEAPKKVGMDTYSFCEALGPEEGNRQLRRHWKSWVTEEDISTLFQLNLDTLRIPVGDWMWRPYGAYVNCTDGALPELQRVLELAGKYGLKVLLDIHGLEGSQNGLDNSGRAADVRWTANVFSDAPAMQGRTFSHWATRKAEWIGKFDLDSLSYTELYWDRVDAALDVVRMIADQFAENAAIMGVQPVNEPWQFTPIGPLKRFYWEGYKIVKRRAPGWKYFMHDSFRLNSGLWTNFMNGCPDVVMDTHIYTAWNWPGPAKDFYSMACEAKHTIAAYEANVMPVVVGEWSLATDNCAMWLNGFNDNIPGYPMVQCDMVPCPEPYMSRDQPGAPPDPTKGPRGPFGTGESSPSYGMCPVDRAWREPSDAEVMKALGHKKLNAFSTGHGWIYWNFKTELEPKWDYVRAVEAGWLPRDAQAKSVEVALACASEDIDTDYECKVKPGATYDEIIAGVNWACASAKIVLPGCHAADDDTKVAHASKIFNGYFNEYHSGGATCDFGGAADLTDMSSTPKGREPCAQLFASLPGQKGTSGSAFPPAAAPSPVLSGCALLVASLAIGTMLARRHRAARSSQDGTLREQLVHLSARGVVDAEAASQAPESHPRLSAARHSS